MPITPIDERVASYDLFAFAAPETMPHIAARIEKLVRAGRGMTCVRRFLGQENTLRIEAGLRLDTDNEHDFSFWQQANPVGSGVGVILSPGIVGFGVSAYEHDVANEEAAARKWHDSSRERRNVTYVHIAGHGDGARDRIQIIHYNDYGVGEEITIAFDRVRPEERAAAEVKVVQALRDGQESWTGDELDQLIVTMSDRWESAQKAIKRITKKKD